MMVLVTYDVSTESPEGRRRLRHVAKACVNHGQRVQNSVFECLLDPGQYLKLKNTLSDIIDQKTDSLRFYNLGNSWDQRVEKCGEGKREEYNPEGLLLL
jgi:CRISPR-associated protein Cas2